MTNTNKEYSLAVIIPFYNGKDFIERAIISVFAQTWQASELIIVNDGSKKEEKAYLYDLQKKYDFLIIDKENGGQGDARNVGVNHSTTHFICFLDQDDFYKPRHNEILLSALPEYTEEIGFIYADVSEADGSGNIERSSMIKEHSTHPKTSIVQLLSQDMFILPSASLINKKAYNSVGGFDATFTGYEDDDLFLRLFRAGYEHKFVDTPVTVWCIHSESTSYSVKMSRSRMRYINKLVELFPDDKVKARYYFRDLIIPRFTSLVIQDYINAIRDKSSDKDELEKLLLNYYGLIKSNSRKLKKLKNKIFVILFLGKYLPGNLFLLIQKLKRQVLTFN